MRLRTKLLLMALAGLAGFLASRPDIRKRLTEGIEEAIEEAKQAAVNKEKELTQEVKSTQEETK